MQTKIAIRLLDVAGYLYPEHVSKVEAIQRFRGGEDLLYKVSCRYQRH